MPGSFSLIVENLYEDISDSELADLDDEETPPQASYADAVSRVVPSDDHHNDDYSSNHDDEHAEERRAEAQRSHLGQHCFLSDFEQEKLSPT